MNDKKNIRMCVCCRERKDKYSMIRVAASGGVAVIDEASKLGGRGGYICSAQCLENSIKGRRLDRAVKCSVGEDIYSRLRAHFELIEKRES